MTDLTLVDGGSEVTVEDDGTTLQVVETPVEITAEDGGTEIAVEDSSTTLHLVDSGEGLDLVEAVSDLLLAPTIGGAVSSVFGRTGAVIADPDDYAGVYDPAGSAAAVAGDLATHEGETSGAHGMTAYGASLVDDDDAATARATLELGSAAVEDVGAFDPAGSAAAVAGDLATHVGDTNNPHSVTASQAGALATIGASTDNALARWNGASGDALQNSSFATLDDSGNLTIGSDTDTTTIIGRGKWGAWSGYNDNCCWSHYDQFASGYGIRLNASGWVLIAAAAGAGATVSVGGTQVVAYAAGYYYIDQTLMVRNSKAILPYDATGQQLGNATNQWLGYLYKVWKCTEIDTKAAADLLLKYNGTTKLTVGSAALTAAVPLHCTEINTNNANDLLLKQNGTEYFAVISGGVRIPYGGCIYSKTSGGTVVEQISFRGDKIEIGDAALFSYVDFKPGGNRTCRVDTTGIAYTTSIDTSAASDLLLKHNGTTKLTVGSAALTAAVPLYLPSYTVAALPAATAGAVAYASNGRKAGEGAGAGTGVLVFYDSTSTWIACDTGVAVAA